ncbi:unnamed protein product [Phytomonas sp. EM1]|nr:unnamed protein product [Phytomonas sp. EM1]|eukprot:CCW60892.1 unnamed protein product [Phytomonas sp. isolate EM1]
MKVLVCGGAGYIGTQFVRCLLRRTQHSVIIVDSLEATHGDASHVDTEENWKKKQINSKLGDGDTAGKRFALLEVGDVRNEEFLNGVFTKHGPIDAVVHMCGYIAVGESTQDPLMYYDNNVIGMIRLLQTMRRHGCDKLILSSSAALFGNVLQNLERNTNAPDTGKHAPIVPIMPDAARKPESPYGRTKYVDEMMLEDCATAYGIKSVCLRYFNACGADEEGDIGETHDPETHLIPLILQVPLADQINAYNAKHHPERRQARSYISVFGTDYDTPDGTCIRDYVHVFDLSMAHIQALDYLASLKPEDKNKFFLALNLGTAKGNSVLEVIEAARRVTGHPIPIKEEPRREGDPPVLVASGEAAKEILGWKPEYDTIDKIIASAWRFHSKHVMGYEKID